MRTFTILIATMLFAFSASAQDLLVKRNGEQMRVKVLKITKKKVEFVRQGTNMPVYTLPVSDIDYIEYPLGDRDTFSKSEKVATPVQESVTTTSSAANPEMWHGAVAPPDNSGAKAELVRRYSVGEIYEKDGVKGIVALLYDGGIHGLVMSLDEACLAWSKIPRRQTKLVGATDRYNGLANMKAVERYIADNNLSWDMFPAFKWCRDKGEGWFLPSINELWSAGTMSMGGSRAAINRKFRRNYNNALENADGTPLNNLMFYHSSTEDKDAKYSLYSHMNSETPNIDSGYKADELFVRAFYKF